MISFYDLNNNRLDSITLNVVKGEDIEFITRVDCKTGLFLIADSVNEFITIYAKEIGASNYINIELNPIDLSQYNNLKRDFQIKIETTNSTVISFYQFNIQAKII